MPSSLAAVIGLSNNDVIALRFLRPLREFRYVPYVPHVACVALDGNPAADNAHGSQCSICSCREQVYPPRLVIDACCQSTFLGLPLGLRGSVDLSINEHTRRPFLTHPLYVSEIGRHSCVDYMRVDLSPRLGGHTVANLSLIHI